VATHVQGKTKSREINWPFKQGNGDYGIGGLVDDGAGYYSMRLKNIQMILDCMMAGNVAEDTGCLQTYR
jgi:hypothetical protein